MRTVYIFVLLMVNACWLEASVLYNKSEYRSKGKHYDAKTNILYYSIYKSEKKDKLTLLYFDKGKGTMLFKGFCMSKSLEEKVPMLIMKYIGKYITDSELKRTNSIDKALSATKSAIEKALDKTWLESLKSKSVDFSKRPLYKREYAGFDMNYYEFFPLEKDDLTNPTDLNDTVIFNVYRDSILKTHEVFVEKSGKLSEVKDNLLKKPDFDKTISWQKYRYDNLMDVIVSLKQLSYHHKHLKISDWPLASSKHWGLPKTAPNGFHIDIDSACKYLIILQKTLKKEELMPTMAWKQNYGNWKATRCNMFAGDFSQEILGLNTYPWGTKDLRAHEIHDKLQNMKEFISIPWDKVWGYVELGFPIFITIPKVGPAGHIAIAYPIDKDMCAEIKDSATALKRGSVVQAGASNGLMTVNEGFSLSDDDFKVKAKVYIYLGYLND